MAAIIAQRVAHCKDRLQQVEARLALLAQEQQDLLHEALRLQGAIREMESLVVAVPIDGAVVVPQGD